MTSARIPPAASVSAAVSASVSIRSATSASPVVHAWHALRTLCAPHALRAVRAPRPARPAARPIAVPWPALIALGYALVQFLVVLPHTQLALGWDESVYVSQSDPRTPAAFFSAPRSRGISYLVAPITAVSPSVPLLRGVLAVASAAALYGAFRGWAPLLGRRTAALAALLFAGLWITELSGSQVMPNLWVALGAVAAVGWFLRVPDEPRARWWLAGTLACCALLRTPDTGWVTLPLLVTAVCVRRLRPALPALLGGPALGGAQWVAEAYARFGGIAGRLRVSSATEGGMGLHHGFGAGAGAALRSLNGPLLCRPCDHYTLHQPALALWWLALPPLAAAALLVAVRRGRPLAVTAVPLVCAASVAVPYLLLLDYSAPRFLLPAYALLAPPVAALAAGAVRHSRARRSATTHPAPAARDRRRTRNRRATGTVRIGALTPAGLVIGAVLALHLVSQAAVLTGTSAQAAVVADRYRQAARTLRRLGLRPPCLVVGPHAQPVGYHAGCASADTEGNNRSITPRALLRRAAHEPTAVLTAGAGPGTAPAPPAYARAWTAHPLPRTGGWLAYLAPAAAATTPHREPRTAHTPPRPQLPSAPVAPAATAVP